MKMRKRENVKIEEKIKKTSVFLKFFQKNVKKGSILLEIAVGISILAIISGLFIRKSMAANKYVREQLTKSNIETVAMSLASFVANNKRLPRPSETNDGVESDSPNAKFGYVPYVTLGISATVAKDGNLQPLVYIVEPALTANYSQIYEDNFDSRVFCSYIHAPKISVRENSNRENFDSQNSNNNVIAFAIDTKDHKNSVGETIILRPTSHTFWVTRDVLLMKYLKNSPCAIENPRQNSNKRLQGFDDDF